MRKCITAILLQYGVATWQPSKFLNYSRIIENESVNKLSLIKEI